jgi:hypothetical protein
MDNETNESPEWGKYWATYIKEKAAAAGVSIATTEMWDDHDLLGSQHGHTIDHPELYDFIDISQNNHRPANEHWEKPQLIRRKISVSGFIRPINSVKIYGANTGQYGSTRDAQERFWRNIFGGLASSRFHRPPSGLGLGAIAQAHIQSMRMLTDAMTIFRCEPHQDLLSHRSWNEAYCIAQPGVEYAVFFPDGGDILLDISAAQQKAMQLRWLDIRSAAWHANAAPVDTARLTEAGQVRLVTPREEGYWAVLVKMID